MAQFDLWKVGRDTTEFTLFLYLVFYTSLFTTEPSIHCNYSLNSGLATAFLYPNECPCFSLSDDQANSSVPFVQSPKQPVILFNAFISFLDVASARYAFGCNNSHNRHFSTDSTVETTLPNDSTRATFAASASSMNNKAIDGSGNADSSRYFSMESAFEENFSPVAYDVQDQYYL